MTARGIATYSLLTIFTKVGKKSFENMGRLIKKSGDTISRLLRPGLESLEQSKKIAQKIFAEKKELFVAIDETQLKKIHAKMMWGTSWLFDTKIGRCINSYRLIIGAITDGKFTVPINAAFAFGKEFYDDACSAKEATVRYFITTAISLFPDRIITAVLDGAFATVRFLKWAIDNGIRTEVRMHANRVVVYKGKRAKLKDIESLRPKGRQMARTIQATWHGLPLEITAVRRVDKRGNETIVFQAATYKAKPIVHARNLSYRWGIEKLNRTTKQSLGLQECYSTKIVTQFNHVCAVLLAYSITQFEMKKKRFKNPEQAIRAFELKNDTFLSKSISYLDQNIGFA